MRRRFVLIPVRYQVLLLASHDAIALGLGDGCATQS
jgi:hypothetical protein